MIKIENDITEHMGWIDSFCLDPSFSTPFCDKARIKAVSKKENHILLCAYEGNLLTGIFCLLVLEEEKYMETVFLYTRENDIKGMKCGLFIIQRIMCCKIICQRNKHFSIRNRGIWNIRAPRKRTLVK